MQIYIGNKSTNGEHKLAGKAMFIPRSIKGRKYIMPQIIDRPRYLGDCEPSRELYLFPHPTVKLALKNFFNLGIENMEGVISANMHQVFRFRPEVRTSELKVSEKLELERILGGFKRISSELGNPLTIENFPRVRTQKFYEYYSLIQNNIEMKKEGFQLLTDYNLLWAKLYGRSELLTPQ